MRLLIKTVHDRPDSLTKSASGGTLPVVEACLMEWQAFWFSMPVTEPRMGEEEKIISVLIIIIDIGNVF